MSEQSPRVPTKIRRRAEHWQAIMADYEASGLSQEAFCAQASLAMSTFSKWRNQLANEAADAAGSTTGTKADVAGEVAGANDASCLRRRLK